MVGVRVVLVGVLDGRVPMPMPGSRRHGRAVLVLVVFVVRVPGVVADRLVPMGGVPMFLVKLRGVVASGWGPGRARGF